MVQSQLPIGNHQIKHDQQPQPRKKLVEFKGEGGGVPNIQPPFSPSSHLSASSVRKSAALKPDMKTTISALKRIQEGAVKADEILDRTTDIGRFYVYLLKTNMNGCEAEMLEADAAFFELSEIKNLGELGNYLDVMSEDNMERIAKYFRQDDYNLYGKTKNLKEKGLSDREVLQRAWNLMYKNKLAEDRKLLIAQNVNDGRLKKCIKTTLREHVLEDMNTVFKTLQEAKHPTVGSTLGIQNPGRKSKDWDSFVSVLTDLERFINTKIDKDQAGTFVKSILDALEPLQGKSQKGKPGVLNKNFKDKGNKYKDFIKQVRPEVDRLIVLLGQLNSIFE